VKYIISGIIYGQGGPVAAHEDRAARMAERELARMAREKEKGQCANTDRETEPMEIIA